MENQKNNIRETFLDVTLVLFCWLELFEKMNEEKKKTSNSKFSQWQAQVDSQ